MLKKIPSDLGFFRWNIILWLIYGLISSILEVCDVKRFGYLRVRGHQTESPTSSSCCRSPRLVWRLQQQPTNDRLSKTKQLSQQKLNTGGKKADFYRNPPPACPGLTTPRKTNSSEPLSDLCTAKIPTFRGFLKCHSLHVEEISTKGETSNSKNEEFLK